MGAFHDHLRSVATGIVDDIEKAGARLNTKSRRDRLQRAAENVVAYPFAVLGATPERKAELDERRNLSLATLANTKVAVATESRAAIEKIIHARTRQLFVLLLNFAGVPVK